MTQIYSQELIDEIYQEAEIDDIFFNFASGYAVQDEKYFIDNKYDNMVFEETLKLISFLMKTGDFEVGRITKLDKAKFVFIRYENGMVGFEKASRHYMETEGLRCDALSWQISLRKAVSKT